MVWLLNIFTDPNEVTEQVVCLSIHELTKV